MLAGLVAGIMFNKSDAKFPADEELLLQYVMKT